MGCESFDVVRFDLWCLLQGQTRAAKIKSAANLLIIGARGSHVIVYCDIISSMVQVRTRYRALSL